MSTIHQIYCTHCTHGSSALERREGELSHRMLGYSARAGSVEAVELRRYYRQVERYTYYYLPRDTPGEEKRRLTAATAPWRMVYLPSTGGLQIVGQVVYRPTDTEGRPGSYFAHVLFRDEKQQKTAWSVLDCLKLWAAPGWVREDSSAIPFLLRPLASLDELRAGRPAAIDDRVFWSFLTTPAGGEFYDPCGVIPPRWRQEDPARRRDMFVAAFHGLLEVAPQRHVSLLLVIEPSMAALVYYGMFRLLPGGGMRDGVSFSTFEPNTDRLCTTLAATWFYDPQKADLRTDARTRGLVLNTIAGNGWENRQAEAGCARHVVDRLLAGGWSALDRMLANMQAAGAQSAEDFQRLAGVDRMARTLLSSDKSISDGLFQCTPHAPREVVPADLTRSVRSTIVPADLTRSVRSTTVPADDAWRRWPAAVAHLRRTLADEIVVLADPAGTLTPLIGSAAHLLILEMIAGEAEIPGARPAIEFLLRNLPEAMIADVVKLGDVGADYKIGVLSRYVAACGRVPPGCEMVWEDRPPGGVWLLPGILARLDLPTVERLYDSAAEHHSAALVFGLVEVRNRVGGAWLPLTRIVEAVDDGTLLALYRKHGGAFFQHYPADEPAMAQRLHAMLCSLPDHADQFSLRLDVVSAGERLLPSDADHHAAGTWARVRKAVLDIGRLQGQRTRILRTPPIARIEAACRQMIEAIARALPPDAFEDDLLGTRKQECLRRIGRSLLAGQPLLPPNVWQYAGLWQKATWYFQTGKWPAARLAKMRGAKGSPVKAAWIATGVVAAGLFLMATLWWFGAPPGTTFKAPPVAKTRAGPERDAAQRAAAAKAAKEKAEQEGIRQQSEAQRAAAAEAARKRAADEAARQKAEEDDAQRAAEEQSRRVAEEEARRQAEETKARTEQAAAQRAKDEAEAQAEQEHQWLAAARDFADRHRGRLLEAQPFPAGILHLPDEPDPKGDEPPRWFLGAGRLQLDSIVYEFGAGFDRAPPVARHEIPELAEALGLVSAGVEIRQRGQDVMIVATAIPKPIAPEAATGKKEEVKQLENKRQRLGYLLREWHKLDKIEDTEETKKKRAELRDAILGALEIKVPPAPERPTAIAVRLGEDSAAAAARAQQDYSRALAAREQVLNSVEALAREALPKLEARIRQLQAESKGELARQRDENDRAVQQLKSRCRSITAIIYQADARPAPSAELKPTPGIAQLPAQCRVEVVENAYTPTYAETAKLMVQLVPASGVIWPKWFNDDVVAICTVCEYPEEGNTRTFDLVGAVKPKAHLVIAGTQRMAVRFGFFRRTDPTGASDRLVAETSWHTVDEIKRGAEYRLKAPLTADALDKLRALTTTNKQLQ